MRDTGYLGIIGIIGGILMIVGVFLNWIYVDVYLTDIDLTGWEVFDEWRDTIGLKYAVVPLLALICGILVFIMMTACTFDNKIKYWKTNMVLCWATIILSVILIIYSILFATKEWDFRIVTIRLYKYLDIGFWMTMVGSIAALLGGFVPIIKSRRRGE